MGATGLWQFMYQTGKQYNLKIDSYIDERSDPLKATAAAKYMSNMYVIFGDLGASFNVRRKRVKAIRRSGGKQNYWSIRKTFQRNTRICSGFLSHVFMNIEKNMVSFLIER
jgi:membrane-bound lytic murein transglycosylase D